MSTEYKADISLHSLIKAGAHYGHRRRFRHPTTEKYLFGLRNGMHIINLDETKRGLLEATAHCYSIAKEGKKVLFVCTKRAGAEIIKTQAERCEMPYVNHRWLGGLLSNHGTVLKSVQKLQDYERLSKPQNLRNITKKEGLRLLSKLRKLQQNIEGVRYMKGLPAAIFLVDAGYHRIAIREAKKIGVPVMAVVDTNHSIEDIDIVIPGNDDSPHSISIYAQTIADAIIAGSSKSTQAEPQTKPNGK